MIITRTEKGLYLPTEDAAILVASDWEAQEGLISYARLPLVFT
jgi:chaperone required for assembly of F1-ATPase